MRLINVESPDGSKNQKDMRIRDAAQRITMYRTGENID